METMNSCSENIRDVTSLDTTQADKELRNVISIMKQLAKCADCQHSAFCDDRFHKELYLEILQYDLSREPIEESCWCHVCKSGAAVHNGCLFREVLRLKNNFKVFDRRNMCYCENCVPYRHRAVCLREELRQVRRGGLVERGKKVVELFKSTSNGCSTPDSVDGGYISASDSDCETVKTALENTSLKLKNKLKKSVRLTRQVSGDEGRQQFFRHAVDNFDNADLVGSVCDYLTT